MAKPDFYNDNAFRAYPLVSSTPGVDMCYNVAGGAVLQLPPSAIVDFGCVVGIEAEFDETQDYIYLYQVIKNASLSLQFKFRSLCPGLENLELVFSRHPNDGGYVTSYATASVITGLELTDAQELCGDAPLWEGYLVTGSFAALLELLTFTGASLNHTSVNLDTTPPYPRVEPGRIQNLRSSMVTGIHVGNMARTAITAPAGCTGIANAFSNRIHINSSCIAGDVKFAAGYNCSIRQDTQNNALTFSAGVGAGLGEPCEEIKIVEEEESPDGGTLLTGGPTCAEVMKSLNGLSAEGLSLVAGTGVKLLQVGDSEITIDFDLHDLQACIVSTIDDQTPPDDGYGDNTQLTTRTLRPAADVASGSWFVVDGSEELGAADPPATAGHSIAAALNGDYNNGGPAWYARLLAGPPSAFVVSLGNIIPYEPVADFINVFALKIRLTYRQFVQHPLEFTADILDSGNIKMISTVSFRYDGNTNNDVFAQFETNAGTLGDQSYARWATARLRIYANKADGGDYVAIDVSAARVFLTVRETIP